jgi:L-alanine-DL-glutamate epimerase-like enolase superfamily enzyme
MPAITRTDLEFVREPLLAPFGFKGSYLKELWQIISHIEDDAGNSGTGLGVQSVLWSDADVFASLAPAGSNSAMLLTTQRGLSLLEGQKMASPPELMEKIRHQVYEFACQATATPGLKETFALNALVSVDFALWQLYARQKGITDMDSLCRPFTSAFDHQHKQLGVIPLVTYDMPLDQISQLAQEGYFFFKIKIGQNPGGRNDYSEMLAADKARLAEIHQVLAGFETPHTESGQMLYYLDANGRYDTKERLADLLDYMDKAGILSRTVLLEEPFAEEAKISVKGLPVRVAGDESAHSPQDVCHLIDDLGYSAIALKPIAKTLSVTLTMLDEAKKRGVPVFCADLTVNPLMCDWNKYVASRLAPLPGIKIGVVESNGAQNYTNWQEMKSYHPMADAAWLDPVGGVYELGEEFFQESGGILLPPLAYERFFQP